MPIYHALCACGHSEDYYQTIEGRDDAPIHCENKMQRIITAPSMVMEDIAPYKSMFDGQMVTSRSKHREQTQAMREHGLVEVGNETKYLFPKPKPRTLPAGVKEDLIRLANEKLR